MATSSEHAVQSVLAALTRRGSGAPAVPLAIAGPAVPQAEEPPATNTLVVYGSGGRKLNFDPEELQKLPEAFADNPKAAREWEKLLPVYTRKALTQTHFQHMSLEMMRATMERAVHNALQREKEDRKKKNQKKNAKKLADRATRCVLLRNLAPPGGLADALYDDVVGECGRYGAIQGVAAYEVTRAEGEAKGLEPEEAVRIFVLYEQKEAAMEMRKALHLNTFDGRCIAASFFPVDRFDARDLAPVPAAEDKLPAQCRADHVPPAPPAAADGDHPMPDAAASPAARAPPKKILPKYTQALIDVIRAAAAGEEVTLEMIHAADPVAKKAYEDDKAAAIEAEQQEERRRSRLAVAAVLAAQLNADFEAETAQEEAADAAAPPTTEGVDDID